MYLLYVRVVVWALLGMLALCVLPMVALVLAGLIRRFQIWRTRHELERLGFVGSAPAMPQTRPLWTLLGAAVVGGAALIVATLVLPGPPAGQLLASTDGSSIAATPPHAAVVVPSTSLGATHTPSAGSTPTGGTASRPTSSAASVPSAAGGGSAAGAPSVVTAHSTSANAITLTWAGVTGAGRYHVERSTDQVNWGFVGATGGDQTTFTDAALDPGTTYYYRVAAVVGADVSRSDVVSATTTVNTPDAPVLTSATASATSATSVDLAWSDVQGELSYQIQRSPDGNVGWDTIGNMGQDVTAYTDAGLATTTTYYYRVIAVTSDGAVSAPSNVGSATTGPGESSGGPTASDANADPSIAPTAP
jgi:hypothetical protein